MASDDWYYISKSQNINRLKKRRFIVHFPAVVKVGPLCGKFADYRRLSIKIFGDDNLIYCEDCLTHAGEH